MCYVLFLMLALCTDCEENYPSGQIKIIIIIIIIKYVQVLEAPAPAHI